MTRRRTAILGLWLGLSLGPGLVGVVAPGIAAAQACSEPITLFDGRKVPATFDGASCLFEPVPVGSVGTIKGPSYYTSDDVRCPAIPGFPVWVDGQNCYLGDKPKTGFVWRDRWFYIKYDSCARGKNDGANCQLAEAPDGTTAFEMAGGFYTTPRSRAECPAVAGLPPPRYDGHNCALGAKPRTGFVWKDRWFYVQYDACSRGTNDGSNCQIAAASDGTRAFEAQGRFYTTPRARAECPAIAGLPAPSFDGKNCYLGAKPKTGFVWKDRWFYIQHDACSRGKNDGANCQIAEAPAGTRAFESSGGWYTTPLPGLVCMLGTFDGRNCSLGPKPASGFIWKDRWFYVAYDSCSRGWNDGSNCQIGAAPENTRAFESAGAFYTTRLEKLDCPALSGLPAPTFDGKNCDFGAKPRTGFVWRDKWFYVAYDACSRGWNDGANCQIGQAPDGTKAFEAGGSFFTTAVIKAECPAVAGLPAPLFEGSRCYLGPKPKTGFVWRDKWFYAQYDACSRGRDDGANCQLGMSPDGTKAYETPRAWFYTGIKGCPQGTLVDETCLVGTAPANHDPFLWNNAFYYTAARCGGEAQACCSAWSACDAANLVCDAHVCTRCGGEGQRCCSGATCGAGLACDVGGSCRVPACGGAAPQRYVFCVDCNGYRTEYEGMFCSAGEARSYVSAKVGTCSNNRTISDGKCP